MADVETDKGTTSHERWLTSIQNKPESQGRISHFSIGFDRDYSIQTRFLQGELSVCLFVLSVCPFRLHLSLTFWKNIFLTKF